MDSKKKAFSFSALTKKIGSIDVLSIVIAIIIELIIFGIGSNNFFTVTNLLTILQYCALTGLVAFPMTMLMVGGNFDMSLGSQVALTGCIAGMLCPADNTKTGGVALAYLASIALGMLCGFINSFLILRLKMIAFIATMATMQAFRGIAYLLTNGQSKMIANSAFGWLGRGRTLGIPNTLYLLVIAGVIFWFIMKHTVFGRRAYIIGGNAEAARLSGINITKNVTVHFLIIGAMTGFVGALTASQLGAALPSGAQNFGFDVISAVILGGVAMSGGKGNVMGSLLGVLILAILNNGLIMMNVSSYWQLVLSGVVLIIAVSIDSLKQQIAAKNL